MARTLSVRNPRTGENDHRVEVVAPDALAERCAGLRERQAAWLAMGLERRLALLNDWAGAVAADEAVLNALVTDTGRYRIARHEILALPGMAAGWAARAPALIDDSGERPSQTPGVMLRDQLVPYTLVGVISPWNFPFLLSMIDALPALTAGCAVIVKPSEVTPRFVAPLQATIARFPELAAVFEFVTGDGETGAALIDEVDAIAFTGSVATGRKVAEACARAFIPCFLELGGKDPAIVLPAADPVRAARTILRASVQATGQACQSLERVYVHESVADAFTDALVEMAGAVELSYPDLHAGHIGPLIFERQADIIADHIADARGKGAAVRCGGEIENHGGGKWIRPTVLTGVDHSMKVMKEETFGPVIPVMTYRDIDEAVALANDTDYGLSATVIGPEQEQNDSVARRLNAGAVGINDGAMTVDVNDASHDSFGYSGLGVARMGDSGLLRFFRRKALMFRQDEARGVDSIDERQAG